MSSHNDFDLGLLEAEMELLTQLVDRHILPVGDFRMPSVAEIRAGVRFAELKRIVDDAARAFLAMSIEVREATITALIEDLTGRDPVDIIHRLGELNDATLLGTPLTALHEVLQGVELRAHILSAQIFDEGALEALEEAVTQGRNVEDLIVLRPLQATDTTGNYARMSARAVDVVNKPARQILEAARAAALNAEALTGTQLTQQIFDAVIATSVKAVEDVANQAAIVAHDFGRTSGVDSVVRGPERFPGDGLGDGPNQPAEIYASELLDGRTCDACRPMDERTYETIAAALEDYPGYGGYVGCAGGARCRGTLVVVWDQEAAPTVDGPQPRQGASGVRRPDHIDESGRVIVKTLA